MRTNVQSVALAGVVELLESYGQNPADIAKQCGFPVEGLYSQQYTLEGRDIAVLFEHCARACHIRYFGIELARFQGGLQLLGPVWLLMRSAATVGDALESLAKNFLLHTDITSISLKREADGTRISYEVLGEDIDDEVQIIEHGLTLVCTELRTRLGQAWQPVYAQFRYAAPYNLAPLEKVFGSSIHFNQDHHGIFVKDVDLDRSYTTRNDDNYQLIGSQLQHRMEVLDSQLVVKTEILIRALLAGRHCQLDDIATELGISSRTLQRQLMARGVSFQQLVDKVKLDLAKKYLLHSGLSVASVAERLQYSETAAFTRFFKRMTNLTPRKFVQRQSAERFTGES